jgi:3-hydroxyacyl-[acyl-carrier-protein] dehydratase
MDANPAQQAPTGAPSATRGALLDLSTIDMNGCMLTRAQLERINPHRHEMALLDGITWHSADFKQAVGWWDVRGDEFWVRGHFPSKPLLPGVLQVEAGAQLGVFMYNSRFPKPKLVAFTHIHECGFRNQVQPGDRLLLLGNETKFSTKRFTSQIQGLVNGKVTFDAVISGISLEG